MCQLDFVNKHSIIISSDNSHNNPRTRSFFHHFIEEVWDTEGFNSLSKAYSWLELEDLRSGRERLQPMPCASLVGRLPCEHFQTGLKSSLHTTQVHISSVLRHAFFPSHFHILKSYICILQWMMIQLSLNTCMCKTWLFSLVCLDS